MAQPDSVARFFGYLGVLARGRAVTQDQALAGFELGSREVPGVKERQFFDDMAYLRQLLPLWDERAELVSAPGGGYQLGWKADHGWEQAEFVAFLRALVETTNLFPFAGQASPFWKALQRGWESPQARLLHERIVYASTPHPDRLSLGAFEVLVKSLLTQTRVDLRYRNRLGDERRVDFELITFLNHNGVWYLVGDGEFAHRPGPATQPTQLKLSRVLVARPTEAPFRRRFAVAEVTQRLRSTYGAHLILQTQEPLEVTLRFYREAAVHVAESYFHQGQTCHKNPDGTVDLTLRVNDPFDALQILGQWGVLARPLSPPSLVQTWKDQATQLARWVADGST